MKILFASSEAFPFAKSGGLADVAGALPKALRKRFAGCRVVMPLYACINEELRRNMKFITSITVPVSWRNQYCGIFEARADGVIYYLLDNEYYFKRDNLYGYFDDAERFTFFSRAVLEILPHISYSPDIIHCNDWQTALIPVYLNEYYKDNSLYQNIKTVFTIHNIGYQGKYGKEIYGDVLGLKEGRESILLYDDAVNLMKGAIQCADKVTTVSPTYANEILHPYYSYGLDSILKCFTYKLTGIVNGIDTDVYNPETDTEIICNFSADDISGKSENKKELQRVFSLPQKADTPIIGIVSRLVEHKGFALLKRIMGELLKADLQFVILGSGEKEYEDFFSQMQRENPEKVGIYLGFNNKLAKQIYAGSDMFLMPSKYEPCGLSQLIALRYGTVPIVRETGGLNDTVKDSQDGSGNGFTFKNFNAHDLENTVWRALKGYSDKEGWDILRKRAMRCDNGWSASAKEYMGLYKELVERG